MEAVQLFDGVIPLDYGYACISGVGDVPEITTAMENRVNDLIGLANESAAFIFVASRDGDIPFEVYYSSTTVPPAPGWESSAEVSVVFARGQLTLSGFDSWVDLELPTAGRHVVRCSARGLAAARAAGSRFSNEPETDRYRLDISPASGGVTRGIACAGLSDDDPAGAKYGRARSAIGQRGTNASAQIKVAESLRPS